MEHNHASSFTHSLCMATSVLQWQSSIVATETVWPTSPRSLKYLLSGLLQKKFADSWGLSPQIYCLTSEWGEG